MSSALEGLNEAQQYAVTLGQGPILVIAGAGSGKTRTLVHRVAWLVEQGTPPEALLLVTFTRRAAEEMLHRARALQPACAAVQGGTFHSMANRLLRAHGALMGLAPNFTIIDTADCEQIIKNAVDELGLKKTGDRRFPKARTLAGLISKSRNLELSLEETLEGFAPHLAAYGDHIQAAAQAFARDKAAYQLLDYDDLLYRCEELLASHADLRQRLQRKWRCLLVDEYQDTNAVQARLVELLAGQAGDVMAVGDDAQSIYAFRGARLENILEFPQRFPNTRLVTLEENYRSTQPILDLANAVISRAERRYEKNLFTARKEGARPELLRPREQRAQSRLAAERIGELLRSGVPAREIAVLFRAGRDSFDLEAELKAVHIPFVKYGGIRFVELAHVKDVLAHLRAAANPMDFFSWRRVLLLLNGVGPKTAQRIIAHMVRADAPEQYAARLAQAPQAAKFPALVRLSEMMRGLADPSKTPAEAMEDVLEYYAPICQDAFDDYPRRLRDLEELPALARSYESLDQFIAETALDPPDSAAEEVSDEPITLSTVHSAKGKEWKRVFIIWVVDGRLPAFPSLDDPRALEEELRLFYVACTRAGRELVLLAPREQYFDGTGARPAPVSRFLEDLPPGLLKEPAPAAVFPGAPPPAKAPASRGLHTQDRPFAVGVRVNHDIFGPGKVMGYKGRVKIMVYFDRLGLKTLLVDKANLLPL